MALETNPSNTLRKEHLKAVRKHGRIVLFIEKIFYGFQFFPFQIIIGNRVDSKDRKNISTLSEQERSEKAQKRARTVDLYIFIWVIFEVLSFISMIYQDRICATKYLVIVLLSLRFIDIVQVNINILIFDPIRTNHRRVASTARSVILVLINFIEILFIFSIIYGFNIHNLRGANNWWDCFYFSVTTQLTVGYGDIAPVSYFKAVASIQMFTGYLFTILIISSFIGMLKPFDDSI